MKLSEIASRVGARLENCTETEDVEIVGVAPICLLYTSPSPRDLSTSRMPSSA